MQERLRATLAGQTVLVLVLVALTVLFSIGLDRFFTVATLRAVLNQIPAITVVSIGMTFVLITGAIDLSVGSVLALTSACLGLLMARHQLSLPAAAAAVLIVGILSGAVSGSLITFARLPSFIVTLGVLQATRGLALLATGSRPQYIGARVEWLSSPLSGIGISPAFLAAACFVFAAHFVLTQTVFGRWCRALGDNAVALSLSGVDIRPIRLAVFLLSGFCASAGGIIETSRLSTGDPGGARGFELLAIAAAVIGGTSLSGGRGSVLSTFLGVLIIAVLQTGLSHAGAGEGVRYLITGSITVAAVAADSLRSRTTRHS
jgi:ribose transport system permease protein